MRLKIALVALIASGARQGVVKFADLSTAILFIQDECQAHGCRPVTHFDRSLAFIRAGG